MPRLRQIGWRAADRAVQRRKRGRTKGPESRSGLPRRSGLARSGPGAGPAATACRISTASKTSSQDLALMAVRAPIRDLLFCGSQPSFGKGRGRHHRLARSGRARHPRGAGGSRVLSNGAARGEGKMAHFSHRASSACSSSSTLAIVPALWCSAQLAGVDSETAAVDQDVQRRLLLVLVEGDLTPSCAKTQPF